MHTEMQLSIKSMLLCQFVPYPGTVHCTVQVRVRVPGADLPYIYMGFKTHIYTRLVEPDRLGSHHGKSDKTGVAHRNSNKRNFKLSPSPTTAATARRLRPTVLVGRSAGCGGLFRRLEVLHDFHPFLRFTRGGLRLGRLLQAADSLLQTFLLRLQGPDLRCCIPRPRCHLCGPGLQLHRLGW